VRRVEVCEESRDVERSRDAEREERRDVKSIGT